MISLRAVSISLDVRLASLDKIGDPWSIGCVEGSDHVSIRYVAVTDSDNLICICSCLDVADQWYLVAHDVLEGSMLSQIEEHLNMYHCKVVVRKSSEILATYDLYYYQSEKMFMKVDETYLIQGHALVKELSGHPTQVCRFPAAIYFEDVRQVVIEYTSSILSRSFNFVYQNRKICSSPSFGFTTWLL